ncbi:MAG: hypothetical protein AAF437_15010 [Pseudomonadota bacterium]
MHQAATRTEQSRSILLGAIVVSLAACANAPSNAQMPVADPAVELRDRVKQAYGDAALAQLKSVEIKIDRRLAWPGQGQTANFVEYVVDRQYKHLDLTAQTGSVERWIRQNGNIYHNRYVVDADGAASLDYFDMTIQRNAEAGYFDFFSTDYRSSDTLLAQLIGVGDIPFTFERAEVYRGELFDVISLEVIPESQRIDVYVSRQSGLIKRGFMDREIGGVNIIFDGHTRTDGIAHATETRLYLDETLVEYDHTAQFTPNLDVTDRIAIEPGFSAPPETLDESEPSVDAISEDLFHIGQDGAFSTAARHQGKLYMTNPYDGFQDRYAALSAHLQAELPLSHVLLTHHHSDHLDGLADAVALGATIAVTPQTEAWLRANYEGFDAIQIEVLSDAAQIGPFTAHMTSTSHVSDVAFYYHAPSATLYQDDHYNNVRRDGAGRVQPSGVEMYEFIVSRGLNVSTLLSGHSGKAESWSDFASAVAATPAENSCPSKRLICADQ